MCDRRTLPGRDTLPESDRPFRLGLEGDFAPLADVYGDEVVAQ